MTTKKLLSISVLLALLAGVMLGYLIRRGTQSSSSPRNQAEFLKSLDQAGLETSSKADQFRVGVLTSGQHYVASVLTAVDTVRRGGKQDDALALTTVYETAFSSSLSKVLNGENRTTLSGLLHTLTTNTLAYASAADTKSAAAGTMDSSATAVTDLLLPIAKKLPKDKVNAQLLTMTKHLREAVDAPTLSAAAFAATVQAEQDFSAVTDIVANTFIQQVPTRF